MLPVVAFGALAVDSVLQYRASAQVASRIGRDIKTTRAMVQLFRSLGNETIAIGLEKSAAEAHVPVAEVAEVAGLLGYSSSVRTAKARPVTDAALASLGKASPVSAEQIAALRRHVDNKAIGSIEACGSFVELIGRITAVAVRRLSDLSNRAVQVRSGIRLAVSLTRPSTSPTLT
jgi:hypothetical protein